MPCAAAAIISRAYSASSATRRRQPSLLSLRRHNCTGLLSPRVTTPAQVSAAAAVIGGYVVAILNAWVLLAGILR